MTHEQLQQIRAIVYDAYCEGDTEAEWMLAVIDADLAAEQELFAWATFDGEGSYDLRLYEDNENYLDEYRKMNGDKYAGWVIPLYTAPVPAPQRECETCARKRERLLKAGFLKSPLRAKNEVKP